MSSAKGDDRYVPVYDQDVVEGEAHSSSEDEDVGSVLPPFNPYQKWVWDNQGELEDLYNRLMISGRGYFGRAFFQFGTLADFASFIHTHTQP